MYGPARDVYARELDQIREDGLFKDERVLLSPQSAQIGVKSGEGSMKSPLAKEGDRGMHGHIEVPKEIPADSQLWIEVEGDDGTVSVAIAYK